MVESDIFEMFAKLLPHPSAPVPAVVPIKASPPIAPQLAATTSLTRPEPTGVPDDCLTFIENEEDGSQAYYVRHYEHFDWPGGASGPTIGVGYDLGYVTVKEAIADWKGIVSDDTLNTILRAVGLRGDAAEVFVRAHGGSITVTWDQGVAEFKQREVPKWMARCRAALPGFDDLPPLCQGAILSLTYNRGSGGYDDPSPRDVEMRAIKRDIADKKLDNIPLQLMSMRRLWPKGGDLWNRRTHEAALFQKGLSATAIVAQ
jgi:hypothetical protein